MSATQNPLRVLMIDNYDSFTYNIVQYFGELGAQVQVVRNDELSVPDLGAIDFDRLVISPGPCSPAEAGISVEAIRHFAGQRPILGVCLGHQSIGAAFGGRIVRAAIDARQDQPNCHHARGCICRATRAVHGQPLPLAGRRIVQLPTLPAGDRAQRRRRDHGPQTREPAD